MEYLNWSRHAIRQQAFPFVSHYLAADDLPIIPDSPTALIYSIATSNQEIPCTEDAKRQDEYLSIVEEFLVLPIDPLITQHLRFGDWCGTQPTSFYSMVNSGENAQTPTTSSL
jgi:hypothetical protein